METFFAFCYNISSTGKTAVNIEFKGGFYYGTARVPGGDDAHAHRR